MATWETQAATRECQIDANGELTVVERLANLLETGQYADVTIKIGQGSGATTFKAHRLLLATASRSLNQLFASHTSGNGPGDGSTLHITDVEPDAFQRILRYIYTDDIQVSSINEAFALLRMSKQWGLTKLVEKTFKYLEGFLELYEPSSEERKNELCELLVLTEEDASDVNKKCWEILLRDVNKIVPCQGFLDMNKDTVKKLLNHEDFHFQSQLILFEAIRDWGMNQVIMRHLNVNQLEKVISDFITNVDFKSIKDVDFMGTVLPSDCLGKEDLIAFFLSRGLEIPRDLVWNNNVEDTVMRSEGSKTQYDKTCRFKRGYKLPTNEIYKEHEVRFRADKNLKLLGVGFGFLFSNTDMGITVHCQGPWETRQWTDIMQTYCRVTYEKMKTADVRLMFSEGVNIEANQSYKILVRVSRMSAGSSDVDLWGGSQAKSTANVNEAEFTFLKSAVDPTKEVEESEKDLNPGMITDFYYKLLGDNQSDSELPTSPTPTPCSSPPLLRKRESAPPSRPLSIHRSQKPSMPSPAKKLPSEIIEAFSASIPPTSNSAKISTEDESTVRTPTAYLPTSSSSDTTSPFQSWRKRKDIYSFYMKPMETNSGSSRIPPFLSRRLPVEKNKPAWEIPSRLRSIATSSNLRTREPSVTKESEPPKSKVSDFKSSGVSPNTTTSVISDYKSRLSSYSSPSASRYGSGTSSTGANFTSKYGTSPYSNLSNYSTNKLTSTADANVSTSNHFANSRTGDEVSRTSRYGRNDYSALRMRDSSTSRYGISSSAGGSSSRVSSSDSITSPSRGTLSSTSRAIGDSSSNHSGTSDTGYRYGSTLSSLLSTTQTVLRDSTLRRPTFGSGRFSSSAISTPSYTSSTSRFGTSIYRR